MEQSYYSIIPTKILRNNNLKDKAKLLYCDISSLCNTLGYCYAGNEYFAELYGVTKETISRLISSLEEENIIHIVYERRGAEIQKRLIYLYSEIPECQSSNDKKINRTNDKNVKDNNISLNNINIYSANKEKDIKKTNSSTVVEQKENVKEKTNLKDIDVIFEKAWKLYPNKKGKGQISKSKKKELFNIGYEQLEICINRYLTELKKDEWRKPQNGSTFFNSGYIDYLDCNYIQTKETERENNNYGYGSI